MERYAIVVLALLSIQATATPAQSQFGETETFSVTSDALGVNRTVHVALPRGYRESSEPYPVLIVLDGESLFPLATGIAGFMSDLLEIPRMIVVGIPNQARSKDMTPPPNDGWTPPMPSDGAGFGGAPQFVTFLGDELLPELSRRFRTAPLVTLVGHSLGGLFVAYAITERPDAFNAGLTMDPSLWWNERSVVTGLASTLRTHPRASQTRLVSVEITGGFGADWAKLAEATRAEVFGALVTIDSNELHSSMPIRGLREGLRTLFNDFPPQLPTADGSALATLEAQYEVLASRYGYAMPIPISALSRAGRMAVEANNFGEARRATARLRDRGRSDLADPLEERIARESSRTAQFIPLTFPDTRPSLKALEPFLGSWTGRIDQEQGVDSDLRLVVSRDADSVVVRAAYTFPRSSFERDQILIDAPADGTLEFGFQMRGGVGMEVWKATLTERGSRLIGNLEIRGFRVPEGASPPRATFHLRRDPAR